MARWRPGARERIVRAGLDLFNEQGYDDTTVSEIAERAGIARSTFFRYFPDKRCLLAEVHESLGRHLGEGIAAAPQDACALNAVAIGLERAAAEIRSTDHGLGSQVSSAFAASEELQQREILKSVGLGASMADALAARGVPECQAQLAAEMGVLAFKRGFAEWCKEGRVAGEHFGPYALAALDELRSASTALEQSGAERLEADVRRTE